MTVVYYYYSHYTRGDMTFSYVASGFAVGLLVGLTGVGGGSLMTPLLTLLFGINPTVAVGTDLAFAATLDEIYGLSFTFQKITTSYQAACASGHIDSATISHGDEVYVVSSVSVVCTKGAGGGAAAASYARSGIVRIDSTPARISTNMTAGREASAPAISERCSGGACDGVVTMTFTGGQMKHNKTGHVTLMK